MPTDSVGIVQPEIMVFDDTIRLESGSELEGFQVAYETYGTLNAEKIMQFLFVTP